MWTSRRRRLGAGGLLAALLAALPAAAQSTGTLSGTVLDTSSQVLPGATVTATDERTGETRTVVTGAEGSFSFAALRPGSYTVKVELAGFGTFERRNAVLSPSAHLALGEIRLAVGGRAESITVESRGTPVETENSDHAGQLTSAQIAQIQTKGRDVISLLRLVPGVRYEDDVEAMGDSFGTEIPNVSGQRRHWNNVSVDGLNGNELSGTSRFSSAINLDAIAEVKVLLNTYKAEFGRTAGANIQIVSKSGGSAYEGSAYWYGRRTSWNANRWENKRSGVERPRYHFDTYGFNFGGPARVPGLIGPADKLFFFYSLEAPQVEKPGPLRRYRMPTERERRGDFSQTFDSNGRLIVINDPFTGLPYPGNLIPADRIDASGLALMRLLPLPNRELAASNNLFNFVRQETSANPRWNHLLRLDWKPSNRDSLFLTVRTFDSDQYGAEITAGPTDWGYFAGSYIFSDDSLNFGHTRIFNAGLINEFSAGVRRQTEAFGVRDEADWRRVRRAEVGFNAGQFHPELNTLGVLPMINFNIGGGLDDHDFGYDQRLGRSARDWLFSVRDNLTWIRGRHALKGGFSVERLHNNEAGRGLWMGQYDFRRDRNNPLDTNHPYSNLLHGVFRDYQEADAISEIRNRGWLVEWYAQDSWRASRRLTIDYGIRFAWSTPFWQADGRAASFVAERYDPANAPRLYRPALVGGRRVAVDPATGAVVPEVLAGTFVPGSGVQGNGMVLATDPGYPRGFRRQLPPLPEPRVGFAWDVFGGGRTALHASAGLFHHAVQAGGTGRNAAGNPPIVSTATRYYGTIGTLLQPGASLALRPVDAQGVDPDAKTPSSYNFSLGVQQEIGWGAVLDVSYVGTLGRHLEMEVDINDVPAGARFLDLHPENVNPHNNRALAAEFLRPYAGYQRIRRKEYWGTSNYNALQVQLNRRYVKGLQFSVAYTFGKALGVGDNDPAGYRPGHDVRQWYYAPLSHSQTHNLVLNYTWDLPRASALWNARVVRLLFDGWQLSGENAWISGDWAGIDLSTVDDFSFSGGDVEARAVMVGKPELPRGERDATTRWFNTAAFARPSGRGDTGDTPRNVFRQPGVDNWNLSAFKNFPLGGRRVLQLRVEGYNVLNRTQYREINNDARFDVDGTQTNAEFGKAIRTRAPRILQASVRFRF